MGLKSTNYANLVQDIKTNLDSTTKIFPAGIVIHESDSGKIKISDGVLLYKDLPYVGSDVPTDHSSEEPTFGIGTDEKYGHVKIAKAVSNSNYSLPSLNSDQVHTHCTLSINDNVYLYIGKIDGEFHSALVDFTQPTDDIQWNSIGIYSDVSQWACTDKLFKVNGLYIFTSSLQSAYSTDGISWTTVSYSDYVDNGVPAEWEFSSAVSNYILDVFYNEQQDKYWLGTLFGVIVANGTNYEFEELVSVSTDTEIRGYALIGDTLTPLCTSPWL